MRGEGWFVWEHLENDYVLNEREAADLRNREWFYGTNVSSTSR